MLTGTEGNLIMRYLLLAVLLTAAIPQALRAGGRWEADGQRGADELRKDAAALEEQVKLDPGNVELYIRLGFAYTKLENADGARKAFESAVRLDQKMAIVHYMLGLIYEKKGLRDKAIAAWKACLENAAEPRMRETAKKHLHHLGAGR